MSKIGLSFSFQGPNQGPEFRLSHQSVVQQAASPVAAMRPAIYPHAMQQSPLPAQVQQDVEPAAQPQVMDTAALYN